MVAAGKTRVKKWLKLRGGMRKLRLPKLPEKFQKK
jgi:hypothetical protein